MGAPLPRPVLPSTPFLVNSRDSSCSTAAPCEHQQLVLGRGKAGQGLDFVSSALCAVASAAAEAAGALPLRLGVGLGEHA